MRIGQTKLSETTRSGVNMQWKTDFTITLDFAPVFLYTQVNMGGIPFHWSTKSGDSQKTDFDHLSQDPGHEELGKQVS